jgi:hypothetical protein
MACTIEGPENHVLITAVGDDAQDDERQDLAEECRGSELRSVESAEPDPNSQVPIPTYDDMQNALSLI